MRTRSLWSMAAGASLATLLATLVYWVIGPPPAAPSDPGVALILVDALRADRLGLYGADRPGTSPRLDAFAEHAAVFEHALAPAAWTVPSVASLFTGLPPASHGVARFRGAERVEQDALEPAAQTLAERFDAAGWTTAALLKSVVVSADHGMAQGFDSFTVVDGAQAAGASAAELTDAALAWVAGRPPGPWFLYAHYMDPHTPYAAPPPRVFAGDGPDVPHDEIVRYKRGEARPDLERVRALYDEEVRYADAEIGRLVDALPPGTIVAIVADHGEQLGEHGGWLHEHLWEENVRVPFLLYAPGLGRVRVRSAVSTLDVGPTLLELAGLPHEGFGLATSRVTAARAGWVDGGPVVSSYGDAHALWDGPLKLIADGTARLYDLSADPGETRDLAAERPDEVARLKALLDAHLGRARENALSASSEPVDEERAEALKELGYLER